MKAVRTLFLRFLLYLLLVLAAQADDSQLRTGVYLDLYKTARIDLTTYGELQLSDSTPNPSRYLIAERLRWNAWMKPGPGLTNLAFGLNYTFIERDIFDKSQGRDVFAHQHRAEFEIDPYWWISDSVTFNIRNRLEYRWTEDLPDNIRSRHRFEFVFPLKGTGILQDLFTSDEVFYDYNRNQISENRIVPLGFTFRVSKQVHLKTYYMLQATHAAHDWPISNVIYMQWYLSLK